MSFWDSVKKFTQPYGDDDYEDYDEDETEGYEEEETPVQQDAYTDLERRLQFRQR